MRRVNVAEVGLVVVVLGEAGIDVGLVGELPGRLVPSTRKAVLVVVVNTPDLVHAESCVGKSTIDDAVDAVSGVDAVGTEAELVGSPNRGILNGPEDLKITLLVPVGKSALVFTLVLEKHLL